MSDLLLSTIRISLPILFAAYGGLMSERSGVANISLEAGLLFSAFAAAMTASLTGQLWLATFVGIAVSVLMSALFAITCIWGRGDQIVVGTGFNLLAVGLIPVINKSVFGNTGSTPSLPNALTYHKIWPFALVALLGLLLLEFLFRSTRHGLRIHVAGENPSVLDTQGVRAKLVRLRAVSEGGIFVGLGGVYLSLCQGSGYVREMAGGRGFLALAAVIFGAWRPLPTCFACLFFAFADAVQIQLQGREIFGQALPDQFVQILPFVITILLLSVHKRRILPPSAINQVLE